MQFPWFFFSFFVWKIVYHKQTLVLNLAKATQVFLSVRPFHSHVVSFECYVSWCVLKITLFFLSWKSLFIQPCQFLRVCLTIFLMFFHFRIVDHIRRGHSALTRILGRLSSFGGFVKTTIQLLPWMVTALLRNSEQSKHICLRLKFSFVWIICGLTFRCRKWFLYFVQADLFVHVVSHL